MSPKQAIKTCVLKKYVSFSGRASRSEYWYFTLFYVAISAVIYSLTIFSFIDYAESGALYSEDYFGQPQLPRSVNIMVSLANLLFWGMLMPNIGVTIRRLHDMNKSGWWCALYFIPIASFALLIMCAFRGTKGINPYGEDPLAAPGEVSDIFR